MMVSQMGQAAGRFDMTHAAMQFADAQVDPPLTTAQGSLVAVSLGEGVVGLFESKLPFKEIDKYPLHAMSRPLLIIGMLGVGGWQYVRTK